MIINVFISVDLPHWLITGCLLSIVLNMSNHLLILDSEKYGLTKKRQEEKD